MGSIKLEGMGARLVEFAAGGVPSLSRHVAGVAGAAVEQLPANTAGACALGLAMLWLLTRYRVAPVATYLCAVLGLAVKLDDPTVFLLASSFLHYPVYLYTLQFCRASATSGKPTVSRDWFEGFKRQAPILRTLGWAHLVERAVRLLAVDAPTGATAFEVATAVVRAGALPVAVIAGGLALATLSYVVLGHDATFFGFEMGFYRRAEGPVTAFPYSTLPHPMILGDVIGLCGFLLVPGFMQGAPTEVVEVLGATIPVWRWMVPAHIAWYAVVCLHEVAITKGLLGPGGPPMTMPSSTVEAAETEAVASSTKVKGKSD